MSNSICSAHKFHNPTCDSCNNPKLDIFPYHYEAAKKKQQIRIAVTPFYGSPEWCFADRDGTLCSCAVGGCQSSLQFYDHEDDNWVCFTHGALTLRRLWNCPEGGAMFLLANPE